MEPSRRTGRERDGAVFHPVSLNAGVSDGIDEQDAQRWGIVHHQKLRYS